MKRARQVGIFFIQSSRSHLGFQGISIAINEIYRCNSSENDKEEDLDIEDDDQ